MYFEISFGFLSVINPDDLVDQKFKLFLSCGITPPEISKITGAPLTTASVVEPAPGRVKNNFEDSKRIASEIFSRLAITVGFKKLPDLANEFIGKQLRLGLKQVEETWENDQKENVTSLKTKILKMEPSEMAPTPVGDKPPF